jgi:hypothetical protein
MTTTISRQDFEQEFIDAILKAMDEVTYKELPLFAQRKSGYLDAHLPDLLPVLRKHANATYIRLVGKE